MKVEAIIAHRGEKPENLHRTYYNLRRHGVTVRLVEDVAPALGCGQRRHEGIMESRADVVFLCDGHMTFSDECIPAVIQHLRVHPLDLTVHRMESVGHDWVSHGQPLYAGARIEFNVDGGGGQYWPLAARWRKEDTGTGPIGAVMGACYGMTRDRYVDMGHPLSMLQAWGCDEEALSIACWMTGGRVCLVDGVARHMYAAPRGWKMSHDEALRIWANRVNLMMALPAGSDRVLAMDRHMLKTGFYADHYDEVQRIADRYGVQRDRLGMRMQGGDWSGYVKRWCADFDPAGPGRDPSKVDRDREPEAVTPKRQYIQAPRVVDWGVACPHCSHRYDHRVTNTWPNGNRRVLCGSCGYPFTVWRGAE